MATLKPIPPAPKAFLSYSWDDDAHKEWVKQLATRLFADGVVVTLDHWHAEPGDPIPAFMEWAIRENDFVIAVCTPRFKARLDGRDGGVGYEGEIMTAYAFTKEGKKKFLPVLRRGSWGEAAPTWLLGRARIDLSGDPYPESEYNELLRTLHNAREKAPPLGPRPNFDEVKGTAANPAPAPPTPPEVPLTPQPRPPVPTVRAEPNAYIPRPEIEKRVVDLFRGQTAGSADLDDGQAGGTDGPRIVTLKAGGGMGKTRLARRCMRQVADLFPDGVHFVSLATVLPSEEAIAEAIGPELGLPAKECQPATVLDHLKGRTTLLVLDNYESVDDPIRDPDGKVYRYLIRLIDEAPGLRLLVTGRSAVNVPDVEQVIDDLEVGMTPGEARELFLARARLRWGTDRVVTAAEDIQLARILDLTAGIPLAVELAAAWVGHCEFKEIADGLKATTLGDETGLPPRHRRFDVDASNGRHNSLTRSLDWSYGLLGKTGGKGAQVLFATCGLFADSFDEPTVAAIAGIAKAQNELRSLLDASLIRREAEDGTTRYRLHRFTRGYALSRLDEDSTSEETRRRFADYYARLIKENASNPNDTVHYALLDKEWRNALAAFHIAKTVQDMNSQLSMFTMGQFLRFRGFWSEEELLYIQILVLIRSVNNRNSESLIFNNMGSLYMARGAYGEALDAYAKSLEINREFKDRLGEGRTLNNMGVVYEAQGRHGEALDAYAKSLEINRELKDRLGEGRVLENLALLSEIQNNLPEAIRWARQAVGMLATTEATMDLERVRRTLDRFEEKT